MEAENWMHCISGEVSVSQEVNPRKGERGGTGWTAGSAVEVSAHCTDVALAQRPWSQPHAQGRAVQMGTGQVALQAVATFFLRAQWELPALHTPGCPRPCTLGSGSAEWCTQTTTSQESSL